MLIGERRLVQSRSNANLLAAAEEFLSAHPEILVIGPSHSAGEELAHRRQRAAGVHRLTLVQLASDLSRPAMALMSLAPLTPLGLEALSARVVHAALKECELHYFKPVASLPGFARALARTIGELRMARVESAKLAETGAAGQDLAKLLERYNAELESGKLADAARMFELATRATETRHRWLGLPLLLLDVQLTLPAQRDFVESVASRAPSVLVCALDDSGGKDPAPVLELEHLRAYLFSPAPPAAKRDGALEMFSAPGEGLETVEIARRIMKLARSGTPFDRVAILLRSPERYQPMIEEALRRACVPAYFSRGTARPDPGGRAFLALLACAAEKCSASRFTEYLSLGQVPPAGFQSTEAWVPADDEILNSDSASEPSPEIEVDESAAVPAPAAWEKLLVDAAVIGGRDRWQRRLRGLASEFELHLKTLERDDDPRREHLVRRLAQLRQLEAFALPLIETLAALPASAHWKEWIAELSKLARAALRRPEPVFSVLAEFEPMGEVGPAAIEEVAEVLSERLRFLRRDPPQRRYGRVFVGSIDEARGREFGVVFLPGLAEGLFPRRAFEDPLLLDEFRRAAGAALPLRDDHAAEERMRLRLAAAAARERLIASYPRMDVAEARPRVPSFYALELPRAVEGRLPELKEFEKQAREAAPARLNWPAPAKTADAIDPVEYDLATLKGSGGARYLVDTNQALARSLRARWRRWAPKWSNVDGLITKDAEALAALEGQRLRARAWSPSSLQQFATCPYKFALHGVYGLRPRDQAVSIEQMDPLTRGALFHQVQFALFGQLRDGGTLPVTSASLARALELADRVLDQVAAK